MADGKSGDCQGNVQEGADVENGRFPLDGNKAFSHPQKKGNDENDAEEPAAKKRRDMILPVAVADGLPVFVSQIKRIEVKGDDGKSSTLVRETENQGVGVSFGGYAFSSRCR